MILVIQGNEAKRLKNSIPRLLGWAQHFRQASHLAGLCLEGNLYEITETKSA